MTSNIKNSNFNYPLISIFLFSIIINIIFISQLKETPLYTQLQVDEEGYHEKALKIVNEGWLGESVFYQAPLYPYLLAITYKTFGVDIEVVRYIQILLSLINLYLTFLLGKNLFDHETGLLSAAIAAFYGMFVMHNALILKSNVSVLMTTIFLLILFKVSNKPSFGGFLVAGSCMGFNITLRGNYFLIFPGVVIWIFYFSPSLKAACVRTLALGLGVFFFISPLTIRNYYLEKDLVLTDYQAGANFYIGNNPYAEGTYTKLKFVRAHPEFEEIDFRNKAEELSGKKLKPSEISGFWYKETLKNLQSDPIFYLKLFFKKILLTLNHYEIPDNYSYYLTKTLTPVLKICFVSFGPLLFLALLGIFYSPKASPQFWLMYLFLITYALSLIIFFIVARYRIPLIPALIPFAAHFLLYAKKEIKNEVKKPVFWILICIFGYAIFRPSGFVVTPFAHYNLGSSYFANGEIEKAIKTLETAIQIKEDFPEAHNNLAIALEKSGDRSGAKQHYRRAIAIDPEFIDARFNLGILLEDEGSLFEAKNSFLELLKRNPDHELTIAKLSQINFKIGNNFASQKKYKEAETQYLEALRLTPNNDRIHNNLGTIYAIQENFDKAVYHFSESLRINPADSSARQNLDKLHEKMSLQKKSGNYEF